MISSYAYYFRGNVLTITDPLNQLTMNEYDKRGLLIKITDAKNRVMFYDYNRSGRKIVEISPKCYVVGAAIDTMSRKISYFGVMRTG